MKWFSGPIVEAVQTAKASKIIMIVYIHGKDDKSKTMLDTWESRDVQKFLDSHEHICLKLDADSEECVQFSSIYPVVCVPSTFFISGNNGLSQEIIGGEVPADSLLATCEKVFTNHTASLGQTQTKQTSQNASVASDDAQPGTSSSTAQQGSEELPEKIRRAEELIEKRRLQKLEEEKQKELNKEKERIQLGKDLGKLKRNQAEQQAKERMEEMRKEKEEERRAREKVREEIARDRAERARKFQTQKEEKELERKVAQEAKDVKEAEAAAKAAREKASSARIQLRFPDGSFTNHVLPADALLQEIFDIARENFPQNIQLCTTYPRRVLETSDLKRSFRDLELAPSSVIMVLPLETTMQRPTDSSGSLVTLIMGPFIWFWGLVMSFFASPPPPRPPQERQMNEGGRNRDPTTRQERAQEGARLRNRKEGNIHRLSAENEDDDSGTWNGNSTQQM